MADYIRYANQNAGRNQPLSADLIKRLSYLQDMGLTAEVFSGGVGPNSGALSRSGRHVHGNAGDMSFFKGDRRLDWGNPDDLPVFQDIVRQGKEAGITGFGAGPGYMGQGTMHVGMGNPGVWGSGGRSANAPDWLREAYGLAGSGGQNLMAGVKKPMPTYDQASRDMGLNTMAAAKTGQSDPVGEVLAAAQGSVGSGASGAATVAATAQEPTLGDKIGKALFGEKLAADLKGSFGTDAKPNALNKGLGLFAGAFGNKGNSQQQQAAMNIDPSSLGSVEAADAQRSQGAQQLMAALLAGRRRTV